MTQSKHKVPGAALPCPVAHLLPQEPGGRATCLLRTALPFASALLVAAASLVGWPRGGASQAIPVRPPPPPCEEGVISRIFVDNHSIYDVSAYREDARYGWLIDLANALHVRTRASFVESELLFRVGDCLDPILLEESERLLRDHDFIARSDIFALRQPDGTYHVVVDTEDEWTTQVRASISSDGFRVRRLELSEENLLGQGVFLRLATREEADVRLYGGELFTPRVLGTRWNARLAFFETRVGRVREEELSFPFVGEVGHFAAEQLFRQREEFFEYLLPRGEDGEVPRVLLPFSEERADLTLAARVGTPGNLTTFGVGFTRIDAQFDAFADRIEFAPDGDIDEVAPAPDTLREAVAPQSGDVEVSRLTFLLGQRNLRFEPREGLDALRGIQDVPLGTEFAITIGRALGSLGGTDEDEPDDLYARFHLFAGTASERAVVNGGLDLEGRQVFSGGPTGGGWRDVFGQIELLAYLSPRRWDGHTLVGRLAGVGGWSVEVPYQVVLGGARGVRGYRDDRFAGGRFLVASLEDRIVVDWPAPELLDFGFSFFGDVGRVWDGDVPFGANSGWKTSLGAGIRLGFPQGTGRVARLDFAVPVSDGLSETVLRLSFREPLRLGRELRDPRLDRTIRLDVGTDRFGRGR